MASSFQLFLYTVDEYKRFTNHLPIKEPEGLSDSYTEADYIGVQVRLMLLRKYYSDVKWEKVSFKKLISEAKIAFPDKSEEWQSLSSEFDQVENQQLEHILADGTKLNIYTTIEDTVYGLYLHADEQRILNLEKTTEAIRFFCTRKYIVEIESIIFRLYDLLVGCGANARIEASANRSATVYLGDTGENTQSVTGSPYWSNVYGRDATYVDLKKIGKESTIEDKKIIQLCIDFVNELRKTPIQVKKLRKYIHPAARPGWGNFKEAQVAFSSIPDPGFSTKVRYNEKKDTAYVRVFPNVEGAFVIDTPHVFDDIREFALGKWLGRWRIYQFGGHLDSIYETRTKKNK